MKVLFVGDTHGNDQNPKSTEIAFETAKATGCDLIFQLGDFGYWEHDPSGVAFLDAVNYAAFSYGVPIYFLDGNHDKTSLLLRRYKQRDVEGFIQVRDYVKYSPRGHRWTWDGLRFVSFGGAYSVDKAWRLDLEYQNMLKIELKNMYREPSRQLSSDTSGTLWFPEEEMTDIDMDKFLLEDSSPVDIMLAHDMPRGANPRWNRKNLQECWPNQDRLQKAVRTLQPSLYMHGHLHYRYADQIRCGDNYKYTTVIGLNADGDTGFTHMIDLSAYRKALDEDNQDACW